MESMEAGREREVHAYTASRRAAIKIKAVRWTILEVGGLRRAWVQQRAEEAGGE